MLKVSLLPDTLSSHISHALTGLSDLASHGEIGLEYDASLMLRGIMPLDISNLYLEVQDTSQGITKRVCIDMADANVITAPERLEKCDVYYKRSYDPEYLKREINKTYLPKIHPYGLYFACKSSTHRREYEYVTKYIYCNRNKIIDNPTELWKYINYYKSPIRSSLFRLGLINSYSYLVDPSVYEGEPRKNLSGKIMLFTRIWDLALIPEKHREAIDKLNMERITLVSTLKREFGDKFAGGITESSYSIQQCPELIVSREVSDRENYLKLMKTADICIATTGIHGSIGAKLPEYLAASKCIVSEPLNYHLPEPLEPSKNVMFFDSPEKCVSLCKELLEDKDRAIDMMKNAHEYYVNYAKPGKQMYNRLTQAIDKESSD